MSPCTPNNKVVVCMEVDLRGEVEPRQNHVSYYLISLFLSFDTIYFEQKHQPESLRVNNTV